MAYGCDGAQSNQAKGLDLHPMAWTSPTNHPAHPQPPPILHIVSNPTHTEAALGAKDEKYRGVSGIQVRRGPERPSQGVGSPPDGSATFWGPANGSRSPRMPTIVCTHIPFPLRQVLWTLFDRIQGHNCSVGWGQLHGQQYRHCVCWRPRPVVWGGGHRATPSAQVDSMGWCGHTCCCARREKKGRGGARGVERKGALGEWGGG